ncbi:MAG: hypothetical protein H0X24_21060 [Ktedonobacterales bacterium]|nr:hypothetical protein [Ktedonobacterales bacterium]
MGEQPKRDPWELADDEPMLWRRLVAERAEAIDQTVTSAARWQHFALQSTLEVLIARPSTSALDSIVLYGPLANGVATGKLTLAAVIRTGAPPEAQSAIWDDLCELFADAEHMYALKIDCLLFKEEEIRDPLLAPYAWQVIAHDHLVVWAGATVR